MQGALHKVGILLYFSFFIIPTLSGVFMAIRVNQVNC